MSAIQTDFDRIALLSNVDGWTQNNHYHNFLLGHVPAKCESALEIGCGTGAFSRRLAQQAQSVLALDLSPEMIRIARQNSTQFSNIEFQVADVIVWNFPGETFDCIASLATLHHLPLRETLLRMRDSLKIGGVLLVLDLFERARNVLKPEGLFDSVLNAVAIPTSVSLRFLHHGRLLPPREVRTAWAAHEQHDTYPTMNEVRMLCAEILPGARVKKHLLWRYSVVWKKTSA
jgi:ubiquinone/menaquinone biosynthesis C-methylase UbiE